MTWDSDPVLHFNQSLRQSEAKDENIGCGRIFPLEILELTPLAQNRMARFVTKTSFFLEIQLSFEPCFSEYQYQHTVNKTILVKHLIPTPKTPSLRLTSFLILGNPSRSYLELPSHVDT
jgi:hypothetical protein